MKNSLYCVTFYKKLCDHRGHEHECPQGAVETLALTEQSAIEDARLRFADQLGIAHWSMRADYEKIEPLKRQKCPTARRIKTVA